jgi:hypothetical protein
MEKVKQLYLERRYKHCAALCEEILNHDASEVAFLLLSAEVDADNFSCTRCTSPSSTSLPRYVTSRSAGRRTTTAVISCRS